MRIGAAIRRAAGPLEPLLADTYRAMFFDIAGFAGKVAALDPERRAREVVEVGCGEGALISHLVVRLPKATFTGIDTAQSLGRLFSGHWSRTVFRRITAEALAAERLHDADIVLLCDVLHHVPPVDRATVLEACARLLKPGGKLVVKEWIRQPTPAYWAGWLSDRFITGDRVVYQTREEWLQQVAHAVPELRLEDEWALGPWACNHAFVFESAK